MGVIKQLVMQFDEDAVEIVEELVTDKLECIKKVAFNNPCVAVVNEHYNIYTYTFSELDPYDKEYGLAMCLLQMTGISEESVLDLMNDKGS